MSDVRNNTLGRFSFLGSPWAVWVPLVALAVITRVATITQSFWWDECITASVCQAPWSKLVHEVGVQNFYRQLPLFYIIVRAFADLHWSEWCLRLPSLLFSLGKMPLLYVLVRRLVDRPTALFAVLLLAICPIDVWTAHDARPYAMLGFGALLGLNGLVQAMERGKRSDWIQFTLGSAIALHASYFGFLSLTAQGVCFLALLAAKGWELPKAERRALLRPLLSFTVCCIVALLLYAPCVPFTYTWMGRDFAGASGEEVPDTLSASIGFWLIAKFGWGMGWAWNCTAVLTAIGTLWLALRGRTALFICAAHFVVAILPFVLLLPYSSHQHWQHRYVIFVLPCFLLLMAGGLRAVTQLVESAMGNTPLFARWWPVELRWALPCAIVLLCFARSIAGLFVPNNVNFRDIGQFIVRHYETGDTIATPRRFFAGLEQVYVGKTASIVDLSDDSDGAKLRELCAAGGRVWLIMDPWQGNGAYGEQLRKLGFVTVSVGQAQGMRLDLLAPGAPRKLSEWRQLARNEMRYHPFMDVALGEATYLEGDKALGMQYLQIAHEAMRQRAWVECWDIQPGTSTRVEQLAQQIEIERRLGMPNAIKDTVVELLQLEPKNDYVWYVVSRALKQP